MTKPFRISERVRSFKFALNGLLTLFKTEHNTWIHAAATLAVIAAGFFFNVTRVEWCLLVFAIASVWVAEAFNTAIEFLADAVSPDVHPLIKQAKDVAAAAVLIAAIGAAVVGVIVFWPYVFTRLKN